MQTFSEYELEEWFSCVFEKIGEGRYRYRTADRSGTQLDFSFDLFEGSIQTIVRAGGEAIITVVHENASRLWLQDLGKSKVLWVEFLTKAERMELKIEVEPRIQVEWSTLRIDG